MPWRAVWHARCARGRSVPDGFFPELKCPLGKPLGPPVAVPGSKWEYTRDFEHAAVVADLSRHAATKVVWHSCHALQQ